MRSGEEPELPQRLSARLVDREFVLHRDAPYERSKAVGQRRVPPRCVGPSYEPPRRVADGVATPTVSSGPFISAYRN
jgi:hypothetical protein